MEYSQFYQGNYVFRGLIICENRNKVGDDAKAILYELDDSTAMDYVTEDKVRNGRFRLIVKDDFNDWPTPRLELFIKFENCCGYYWTIRIGGFLKNSSLVSYTLHDDKMYASIYG
uniref:Transthyretin-like family protein n=1 Tax=Panagrolaimus sp. PS1159 TaxID=55785 RepID=A0AC35GQG4_9BILA